MVGFCPVSEIIMMMRLKEKPSNNDVFQGYAPTADHDDSDVVITFCDNIESVMKYVQSGDSNNVM